MTFLKPGGEVAPDPLRNPAIALLSECPGCGALPGEPCRNMAWGFEMKLPHYSRTHSEEN